VSPPWKVVIVGGGFGGLSAALHLTSESVDVTMVDRRSDFHRGIRSARPPSLDSGIDAMVTAVNLHSSTEATRWSGHGP